MTDDPCSFSHAGLMSLAGPAWLPEPVVTKILGLNADDLDLMLKYPVAVKAQVRWESLCGAPSSSSMQAGMSAWVGARVPLLLAPPSIGMQPPCEDTLSMPKRTHRSSS